MDHTHTQEVFMDLVGTLVYMWLNNIEFLLNICLYVIYEAMFNLCKHCHKKALLVKQTPESTSNNLWVIH